MGQRLMDGGKEDDATRHHGEHCGDKVQDRMEFILRSVFLQLPPSEEEDQRDPYPRTHRWTSQPIWGKLLMTVMATSRLVHIQEKVVARIQPGQDLCLTWFINTSQ